MKNCLIDISDAVVILCLTASSGLKFNSDHQQPHVQLIQRILREAQPPLAGMFTTR